MVVDTTVCSDVGGGCSIITECTSELDNNCWACNYDPTANAGIQQDECQYKIYFYEDTDGDGIGCADSGVKYCQNNPNIPTSSVLMLWEGQCDYLGGEMLSSDDCELGVDCICEVPYVPETGNEEQNDLCQ